MSGSDSETVRRSGREGCGAAASSHVRLRRERGGGWCEAHRRAKCARARGASAELTLSPEVGHDGIDVGERVRLELVVLLVKHGEEARRGREKRYCRRLHHGRGHVGFGAACAQSKKAWANYRYARCGACFGLAYICMCSLPKRAM